MDIKIGDVFHKDDGTQIEIIRILGDECVIRCTRTDMVNRYNLYEKDLLSTEFVLNHFHKGFFARDTNALTWMDIRKGDVFEYHGDEDEDMKKGMLSIVTSDVLENWYHKFFHAKDYYENQNNDKLMRHYTICPQSKAINYEENLSNPTAWKFIKNIYE